MVRYIMRRVFYVFVRRCEIVNLRDVRRGKGRGRGKERVKKKWKNVIRHDMIYVWFIFL